MHLGEVSFCGKKAQNIKGDSVKQKLLNDLDSFLGLKIIQKHHENYKPLLLPRLQKTPHFVSVKTCGNAYFLYLTKYEGKNLCVFIDKKIQTGYLYPRMIVVNLEFKDEMHQGIDGNGMVLNGEMVCANGDWTFLINDTVLHNVKSHSSRFIDRLVTLYSMLNTYFRPTKADVCSLQVKRYFKYEQIDQIEAFISTLPYTCRGLFFKPVFDSNCMDVMFNFEQPPYAQKQRFKYSDDSSNPTFFSSMPEDAQQQVVTQPPPPPPPPRHQTVDKPNVGMINWWTRKTPQPDVYELYDDDDVNLNTSSPSFIGIAHVSSLPMSRWMRNLFSDSNMFQKKSLSFHWNKEFHKWTPVI